jgi:hypothetical protein
MAETATEVRKQAQEKAQEAASKASDTVRTQVDQRSTEAGKKIASTASDFRSVGDELRKQGKDGPARVADQAAERIEQIGSWLRDSDSDRILGDIEDFGRRQPWAFALGGLALGFAASRFLKASSAQRYEQRQLSASTRGNTPGNGPSPSFGDPGSYGRATTRPPATTTVPDPPRTGLGDAGQVAHA